MKYIKTISCLLVLALLAGCALLDEPDKPLVNGDGGKIAHVKVSIGGNARVILPVFDWNFSKYVLSAEPAEGNTQTAPDSETIDGTDDEGVIYVPYGDWIITVTAYINVSGTDYAAAKGSVPVSVQSYYEWVTIPVNIPESGGNGTFSYKVTYPSGGSAAVKLAPLTGITAVSEPVIDESVNSSGTTVNKPVAGGMYFLTVSAAANGKTVIRNEIVHIYPQLTSNADYIFTKLDFGASYLQLEGTINVKVNGVQPNYAYLFYSYSSESYGGMGGANINFTSTDGSGKWNINVSDIPVGANTIYFGVNASLGGDTVILNNTPIRKDLPGIPIPSDDETGINLGTIAFTIDLTSQALTENTWKDDSIIEKYGVNWYSIDVTKGTNYYLWWNDGNYGDGSKSLPIQVNAWYSDKSMVVLSGYSAWDDPVGFTANSTGTVYIKVSSWSDTGTYAIAYSTNSRFHNNSLPDLTSITAAPLTEDEWVDGEITTEYGVDWYSINVTAGEEYNLWWNDVYDGDDSKTLYIDVYAWYSSEMTVNLSRHWNAWDYPSRFTAVSTGTVYIRVRSSGGWTGTGTYAIKYNTTE